MMVSQIESHRRLQTFQKSFEEICAGEEPWLPLGNFMHQFFGVQKHRREELMSDPIIIPNNPTIEQLRWAAFCASSVEYLCHEYDLPCPSWASGMTYIAPEPWYMVVGIEDELPDEEALARLRQKTPAEFVKRNIFCGNRTYRNKYERRSRLSA